MTARSSASAMYPNDSTMSSPSPVKTTRYPGAIGTRPALALTLFIAPPRGRPPRWGPAHRDGQPNADVHRVAVRVLVGRDHLPPDQRAHRAHDGPGRNTQVRRPLPVHGQAVLRDVVLQGHLEVDDPGDLPDLPFQGRSVSLEQADVLPAHGHGDRLLPGGPAHLDDRGDNPGDFVQAFPYLLLYLVLAPFPLLLFGELHVHHSVPDRSGVPGPARRERAADLATR